MSFVEVVNQVTKLLRTQERISYRVLQREFHFDEADLEDLKEELIFAKQVARDEDGKVLIWSASVADNHSTEDNPAHGKTRHSFDQPLYDSKEADPDDAVPIIHGGMDGERKTITTLFADLKGSTALIEGLDPEDAGTLIDPVLQLMMDAVHQYEGYVAQVLGDGIFALFGAPIAYEDHPQRALHAALHMQKEIRRYSDQLLAGGGIPVQIRVGINTGEVVVRSIRRDDLHTDYVPVGHSANLASRMEQIARPGSIVVSEYTWNLTEGYFDLKALGKTKISGVAKPLNVYEVLGQSLLQTRLQVAARRGLSRFVGRAQEMGRLRRAFAQARIGHGQMVEVVGEPGLGKSRLFHEFTCGLQEHCLVLEGVSVSHGKTSPYLPLIGMLKQYFQLTPGENEAACKQKIIRKIVLLDRGLEETLPYLFGLLGIGTPNAAFQQMDPKIRRLRKIEALKRVFLRESLNRPILLVFEDLQWLDGGTRDFLEALGEVLAAANILLLVNYRPEYAPRWGNQTRHTLIRLAPLEPVESAEMLNDMLGGDASLNRLKPILLEKTQGTPFFLEEVVQTLFQEGVLIGKPGCYFLQSTPTELHISPTVQGVLAARIDRLNREEKDLLRQLAVIGPQFPFKLLARVIAWSEDRLHRGLTSLQQKGFLQEQHANLEATYAFKHVLTRDLAYSTMLQKRRKILHETTAQALEQLYGLHIEAHYGELAHHYSRSENIEKAILYLGLAAQEAVRHSAYSDAIDYLNQAIMLLESLPDAPQWKQQKLAFQITLVASLGATRGFASVEVEQALTHARALCQNAEQDPQLSPVLYALRRLYMARGDLRKADDLADQHLRLGLILDCPSVQLQAHVSRGIVSSGLGNFLCASTHFEKASTLYDPSRDQALAFVYGDDPGALSYGYHALTLWALGYPDRALEEIHKSLQLADLLAHPVSLAWAHLFASLVHHYRHEVSLTLKHAQAVVSLSRDQGLPLFLEAGTTMLGWASAEQQGVAIGVGVLLEGQANEELAEAKLWFPYFLGIKADLYQRAGFPEYSLSMIAQALSEVLRSQERQHEAELFRLQGRITLMEGGQIRPIREEMSLPGIIEAKVENLAETCFQQALGTARQQSARSWELRAAIDLARLWQRQGKATQAYELLDGIYSWFTEGFATPDLIEAKSLLDELGDETGDAISQCNNKLSLRKSVRKTNLGSV
ncbi:MAG: AAA family ATPase [Gammaproteobacteria bacterium]